MTDHVLVASADFNAAEQLQQLRQTSNATGAIATFTGLVRDYGDHSNVTGLFLEHYPGMTEQVIHGLIGDARERWDIQSARVIHRVGTLTLGEQIVFVGVSSSHRADAFAACEFLMDALKTSAPFWKKELTRDGEHWVEQKDSDRERGARWHAK